MILVPGLSWEYGTGLRRLEGSGMKIKKKMSTSTASRTEHPSTVGSEPPLSTVTTVRRNYDEIKRSQPDQ